MNTQPNTFTLTQDNYYSKMANDIYMSVSQFKDFAGTQFVPPCEEHAIKQYDNLLPSEPTTSMLVGSYVDSYFEGTLDQFKKDHPEIFKKTGDRGLRAEYLKAEDIINRIESDPLFMDYLSGKKQVIMTGTLFGVQWKIKMDSYHDDKIVDLKIMKDMNPIWTDYEHGKVDFIRYFGYDIQGAIYQKIVEQNTGKKLPFYIACATKEATSDIQIIEVTQKYLDEAMAFVEENIDHVLLLKTKTIAPTRCEKCNYCKRTKILRAPVSIETLIPTRNSNTDENNEEPHSVFDDV